jgi:hypothetical protein
VELEVRDKSLRPLVPATDAGLRIAAACTSALKWAASVTASTWAAATRMSSGRFWGIKPGRASSCAAEAQRSV